MADRYTPSSDTQSLPDFLEALQGDPFIEIRWKKALVTRLREQKTPKDGRSESTRTGGRFAYRLNATQRIRNAIRAPQAVVKIVRGGGAGSGRDLESQLRYLSRDGGLALDEYEPDGSNFDLQGSSEIKNLSHVWGQRWDDAEALDGRAARSKSKTYHLIVSFSEGTDHERAHDAANTFADRFLTSGELGDRWSHIRAWHTDRAHPHMHIVIDRRGESGRMMQINPAREISPARLRGLQVDAAAEHGLLLNDTPRVSRGLRGQGLSSSEWRAEQRGQRVGRNAHRSAYEHLTSKFAGEIVRHEAQELRGLARTLDVSAALQPNQQTQERFVSALIEAAKTLETGKDLPLMEPQTLERDEVTLEALSAMSVDDLSETMRIANADGSSEGGMAARFRNLAEQATHEPAKTALSQFAAFDPKSIATHLSVLKAAGLNAWSDPAVEAATSANDFDLTSLRSNPQSIYIVIAPNDMEALAPVARLLFQSVIAAMQANTPTPEDKLPVLLLLDEFKTLGRMDSVVNATGTLRGYGGHMLLVVQGLPNLEEVYGHAGASSLMNACQVHAYMSINDPQSKQMISRSLGTYGVEMTQESTSRSFGSFGGSRTASKQLRAMKMIEEDAVNRMGEDSILLIPKDMRPIFARKVIYHQDRALKKLACKSDPRPAQSGQTVATSEGNKRTLDPETEALATQAFQLLTRLNIAQGGTILPA